VPQRAGTQGKTEEYIGRWLRARRMPRDRLVLATKVILLMYLVLFR
jgi:aryl-alcohol dehydrogenase-like predicted oxidoreductase